MIVAMLDFYPAQVFRDKVKSAVDSAKYKVWCQRQWYKTVRRTQTVSTVQDTLNFHVW